MDSLIFICLQPYLSIFEVIINTGKLLCISNFIDTLCYNHKYFMHIHHQFSIQSYFEAIYMNSLGETILLDCQISTFLLYVECKILVRFYGDASVM